MGINALTARKLADKRRSEQIRQVMNRNITKPVRWVLCWGKINYRTGIWEWKKENACYVVRRYEHGDKNTSQTMEGIR